MGHDTPRVLAERLNHLFATVHPRGRGPYSNEETARAICAQGGNISKQYIAYLRKGERDNPRMHHLEALARFFGVSIAYFFDDETADRTDAKLEELAAWRDAGLTRAELTRFEDAGVTRVAMRAVGLSQKGLDFAEVLLDQLREMEGLPPNSSDAPPGAGQPSGPDVPEARG
ncbi:helix-turn-helix domain-containing protein [Streptomyces sp. SP18CS02]|uniref:helix-turn-helix domain-containing protein n=1 Tax=Streptomyces sp. SP18CS02 TaxID=3002531 RepID=UPI002E76A00D|nr:helix-turn-helix domain-containing protein [Streptomyces sp. SP18CS02]MEE1753805.1 helix-turn-helix domain-containing protein [Streptomyces sp. SP18CS02]